MYPNQRKPGTARNGAGFSEEVKIQVWTKAAVAPGMDPAVWRVDPCGAYIRWSDYGVTTHHGNGWEIDHIYPVAHNGTDGIGNLQALQWQNNRTKGDSLAANYCSVSAAR